MTNLCWRRQLVDHRPELHLLKHGWSERVPGTGNAAADHVDRKIQRIHHRANPDSQRSSNILEDALRRLLALHREVVDRSRRELHWIMREPLELRRFTPRNRLFRHPHNRGRRSILLQTAAASASAWMS